MKVRVKFSKYGPVKFIGHLDIMRYFQKAIRRANIPIAFSGGFSPHMIMSFAAPLGVGVTSAGEYFDMELTDDSLSSKEMENRLNATMAEGMKVIWHIPKDFLLIRSFPLRLRYRLDTRAAGNTLIWSFAA